MQAHSSFNSIPLHLSNDAGRLLNLGFLFKRLFAFSMINNFHIKFCDSLPSPQSRSQCSFSKQTQHRKMQKVQMPQQVQRRKGVQEQVSWWILFVLSKVNTENYAAKVEDLGILSHDFFCFCSSRHHYVCQFFLVTSTGQQQTVCARIRRLFRGPKFHGIFLPPFSHSSFPVTIDHLSRSFFLDNLRITARLWTCDINNSRS